jgi:hypothetical protein
MTVAPRKSVACLQPQELSAKLHKYSSEDQV